jgi:dihydrofolate reductase
MRKIALFIAMSLDGYIADNNGGVNWLAGQGSDTENLDVYSEFVKDIDTVMMGWNTYHQVVTELSPDNWVYKDFTTYVFTHKKEKSSEQIRFTSENPVSLLKQLKVKDGKDIWICGGAHIIQQLIIEDMIDEYYISVIPTILGGGIRLFENTKQEIITTGRAGGLHKAPLGHVPGRAYRLIEQSANRADFPGMPLKGLFYLPSFTG